jgi:hypothetical protein
MKHNKARTVLTFYLHFGLLATNNESFLLGSSNFSGGDGWQTYVQQNHVLELFRTTEKEMKVRRVVIFPLFTRHIFVVCL